MLVANLEKAEPLKKIVNTLIDLIGNIEWNISENGIYIHTMNTCHTCVIDVHIPSSAFISYNCEENFVVNISLANFSKILKCISNEQSIYISIEKLDEMILYFQDKEGNTREYNMQLLAPNEDDSFIVELPENNIHDVQISFNGEELNTLIKEFSSIGENIHIEIEDKKIKFSTEGEIGKAHVLFNNKNIEIKVDNVDLGIFSARYLMSMVKSCCMIQEGFDVEVYLSEEKPIMLIYNLMNSFGKLTYFLAPKMLD